MLDAASQRLRSGAAALGCSPAEVLALAILLAAALGTLGLLAALAGRTQASEPFVGVEPLVEEVVVHVAGLVRAPGLYRLAGGARVADALEAAGGALPGAGLDAVNLARPVADGEQITLHPPAAADEHGEPGVEAPGAWRADGRLDLNLATLADLEQLPGIGPVTAQRILEARERMGRFQAVGDLRAVTGIGERRLQAIVDLVDV